MIPNYSLQINVTESNAKAHVGSGNSNNQVNKMIVPSITAFSEILGLEIYHTILIHSICSGNSGFYLAPENFLPNIPFSRKARLTEKWV